VKPDLFRCRWAFISFVCPKEMNQRKMPLTLSLIAEKTIFCGVGKNSRRSDSYPRLPQNTAFSAAIKTG